MTTAEFEKQPRGPYLFDRWIAGERISSPLGPFNVELQMLGDGDTYPPDDEMLTRASELIRYLAHHGEYVLDIVYGDYLRAAGDSDWLEWCGVPRGLSRGTITAYIRDGRSLVVSRHVDWEEPYSSAIYVVPLWDEEHALTLNLREGEIVAANDSQFTLESGVLRWVPVE